MLRGSVGDAALVEAESLGNNPGRGTLAAISRKIDLVVA